MTEVLRKGSRLWWLEPEKGSGWWGGAAEGLGGEGAERLGGRITLQTCHGQGAPRAGDGLRSGRSELGLPGQNPSSIMAFHVLEPQVPHLLNGDNDVL
jgi:hypothetical protein